MPTPMTGEHLADTVAPSPPRVDWLDAGVWQRSGFAAFLAAHGIQRSDLVARDGTNKTGEELRFFRVKQLDGSSKWTDTQVVEHVMEALKREAIDGVPVVPEPVSWVPGFFSLPASTRLASIDLYQQGELYGIDISSGYAVTLLDLQPGEHVLDLCCAPGAKLTMIADLLGMRGSVTGVDFSRPRLNACKQLVHKYRLIHPPTQPEETTANSWRCRLFHADGRSFSIGPKTQWTPQSTGTFEVVLDSDEISARDPKSQKRKRNNKSARAREAKRLKGLTEAAEKIGEDAQPEALYDKVLVDAECTHDGSIKHLQKLQTEEAWTAYVADHLNDSEIQRILELQAQLIRNGFALLRAGGTMIYSTCSLSIQQNEEIVEKFLKDAPNAELQTINTHGVPCEVGKLADTIRFTPAHHTSGLFIAKICKTGS